MVNTLKYASIGIDEVLSSKLRLEANVYNVEARKAKEVLKNSNWQVKTITGEGGIAKAYHRGRFRRVFVEKSDFPIYQPSQILEMYPKPDKYISSLTKTDIDALRVKYGQILMSCSGTIGKCSLVSRTLSEQIFSHDLLRITTNEENDAGYLFAYLQTDIGKTLVITNNYGAVIDHIEPEHLDHIQIPYASEEIRYKIHSLIMQSFALRDNSNELIKEAEGILIDALKLPPIETIQPDFFEPKASVRTYTVGLDELNNRLDGSYHNPIVGKLIDYFIDAKAIIKPLRELTHEITMPGIFKRVYVGKEEGVAFLGTTDVRQLSPDVQKYLSKKAHKKLIDQELKLKQNTILQFNRGSVSVGEVVFVPPYFEEENWTASQNCLRIVPHEDIAGYLFVFLNSDYGNALSRREIYGAVIDMIDPSNTSQIPVPLLTDKWKVKEINDMALNANQLRTQAYYLEKQAIDIMNNEVLYT